MAKVQETGTGLSRAPAIQCARHATSVAQITQSCTMMHTALKYLSIQLKYLSIQLKYWLTSFPLGTRPGPHVGARKATKPSNPKEGYQAQKTHVPPRHPCVPTHGCPCPRKPLLSSALRTEIGCCVIRNDGSAELVKAAAANSVWDGHLICTTFTISPLSAAHA